LKTWDLLSTAKIIPDPNRISGYDGELSDYGTEIARGVQENQAGSSPPAICTTAISSTALPTSGKAKCNHSSSANGTTILPLTTNLKQASGVVNAIADE